MIAGSLTPKLPTIRYGVGAAIVIEELLLLEDVDIELDVRLEELVLWLEKVIVEMDEVEAVWLRVVWLAVFSSSLL